MRKQCHFKKWTDLLKILKVPFTIRGFSKTPYVINKFIAFASMKEILLKVLIKTFLTVLFAPISFLKCFPIKYPCKLPK